MNAPGYHVIEHLSRTRRLDAYEVWSDERACSCVAKTLRPDQRGDARARAALLAEGERLLQFTHPHIVRGYEVLTEPELVVVMETLDGETLAHLVDRRGALPAEDVTWLGLHLSSALRYLHGHDLLHLDVKPANVVADAGRAKLIDLSLARPPGRYNAGVGTWCNLSPEQARGGELGPAADVWGLGTVLYEAATGEPAFDDDDDSWTGDSGTLDTDDQREAGYPQLAGAPPSARGRTAPELAELIDACLAPDPADRPALDDVMRRLKPLAT
jgi:eukaryotic-like serine/threonine-protein kinase